jgi:hypothetical protein
VRLRVHTHRDKDGSKPTQLLKMEQLCFLRVAVDLQFRHSSCVYLSRVHGADSWWLRKLQDQLYIDFFSTGIIETTPSILATG